MRYLQFNNIYIDTQNQLLLNAGESLTLAPKVYDLLMYFCQHHNRVISKDELMNEVWAGTIVTENAISRTLVKVRKALGDDPRNPEFIITVPKKGYRMVVAFEPIEQFPEQKENIPDSSSEAVTHFESTSVQPLNNKTSGQVNSFTVSKKWGAAFAITLLAFTAMSILLLKPAATALDTKQIKPFTREVGEELNPNLSPDLSQIAYTKQVPGKSSYINIENLETRQKMSVSHPQGNLLRPVWAPSQSSLAFLYKHQDKCVIYLSELDEIKDSNQWQTISGCGADSYPSFVFSPDGKFLYFNDRQTTTNGYQVFRVNLSSGGRTIVNQPITSGLGNYAFDLSPDGERLVILNSEFAPKTRIYTLDIAASKLRQTAKQPYLMRSVRWAHDGQTIIHPSPHPAYDIWQSDLEGNRMSVFASNTSRVKHLARMENDQDFVFVSYLLNRDLFYLELNTEGDGRQEARALDNSSVMDYLPTLANHSGSYAFVSKRDTTAEVYLAGVNDTDAVSKQLTFFNNPIKIYHLAFSPKDAQLLIQADNQLYVADTTTFEVRLLPINNMATSGASWVDEQTIIFSTIENNEWQMMQFDLNTEQLSRVFPGYLGGVYSTLDQHFYLFSKQTGKLNKLNFDHQVAGNVPLNCLPEFRTRKLNLMTTYQGLACIEAGTNEALVHYSFSGDLKYTLPRVPATLDISFNSKGVVFTRLTQSVADIMHTVN